MILKLESAVDTALCGVCWQRFLAVPLLLCSLASPTTGAEQAPGASPPWILSSVTLPPMTTPTGDGFLDELYLEWFDRAGLRAELVPMPAARGLENADAGQLDGDAARIDIDASLFANLHKVPEPLAEVTFSGMFLTEGITVQEKADFENFRVGYVRGWRIAERLFGHSSNAMAVRNADILLDMLASDRIDIAFLTVAPARSLAAEKNMTPLNRTEFVITHKLYLFLHSRHRDQIPMLTDILRQMKADGSYAALRFKHSNENR